MHPVARSSRLAWILAALAAIGLVGAGCRGGPGAPARLGSRGLTPDGLAKVSTRGPGSLYVKPNHPVGSYDDIMLARVGIHYAKGQEELDEAQEDVVLDRMIAKVYERVAAGFALAQEPGPCTATMGVYLKDVDFYDSQSSGSQTRFVNSYGAATLVVEFRDSTSEAPLVRYGQRRSLGAGVDTGNVKGGDLERLGAALDEMIEDVGDMLQETIAAAVAGEAAVGCNGNIGKALTQG